MALELSGKRLELFKEAFPKVKRLAVFWHGTIDTHFREAQTAARTLGFKIQWLELRGPEDFDSAFTLVSREDRGTCQQEPITVHV